MNVRFGDLRPTPAKFLLALFAIVPAMSLVHADTAHTSAEGSAANSRIKLHGFSTKPQRGDVLVARTIPILVPVTVIADVYETAPADSGPVVLSVVMKPSDPAQVTKALYQKISKWPEVHKAKLIDKLQAMADLREAEGFDAGLALYDDSNNPLPAVVELTLKTMQPHEVLALKRRLEKLPNVDVVLFEQ